MGESDGRGIGDARVRPGSFVGEGIIEVVGLVGFVPDGLPAVVGGGVFWRGAGGKWWGVFRS